MSTSGPQRRSRFRRRSVHLTRRGAVLVAVGVLAIGFGYLGGYQEALVVGSFALLVAGIGALFVVLARPRLEVVRVFAPAVVAVGSPVRVTLAVRNLGARPSLPGWWNDGTPWWQDARPQRMPSLASASPSLQTGGRPRSVVFDYELVAERRGVFRVGPLAVEHGDAFGTAASVTAQGGQDELLVIPVIAPLPGGALSTAEAEGNAMLVRRRVTGNDDDLTTREYRPGDALRRVHWRASARHGELMVRQEEQRSFPRARLLLDTRRDGYPDADPAPSGPVESPTEESIAFEWVVEMFGSLAMHLLEEGFDVRIEETASPQTAPFGDRWEGARREERFLASLASLHLVDVPRSSEPVAGSGGTGPLFAVLGAPSAATLAWVNRQRRPGETAVAFLGGGFTSSAAADLREHGWIVVEADVDVEPADAWAAAHESWGARRGDR